MQVAMLGPLPATSVHVAEGLKVPVEFVVKLTLPVGIVGLVEVSMTLAVQVVGVFTTTEPGEQLMFVCVVWVTGETEVAARLNVPWLVE